MVFVIAYWRILAVIRRQAKVTADLAVVSFSKEQEPVPGTSGGTKDGNHKDKAVRVESGDHRQTNKSATLSKAKINVVRTMIYICVCFTVCWMPMYSVLMIRRLQV